MKFIIHIKVLFVILHGMIMFQGCLGTGITALGLENLMGIFLFLAAAMALVAVIFLAEQFGK